MESILDKLRTLNKDRFRELIEGLNVITYEFDIQLHRFAYISRMAEAILGYPVNQWFEKSFWYNHIHEDDRNWASELSKYNIRQNKDHEYEYRMIACDGSIKWFKDIVSLTYENGVVKSLYGVLIDMTDRKATEKELYDSKERYKTLVEQQSEMITRWKPDGIFTYVNDVYCNFFGKSKEELIGKTYIPQMPVEDLERFSRFFKQLDKNSPVGQFTHRVIKNDGEIRWLRWTDTVILDKDDNVIEYQTVGRDITARKRAEEALKDSEQQLQLIFDNAPIGMALNDLNKSFLKVNKAYCDIVGYSKSELLTMTFDDISHPDDNFGYEKRFEETFSDDKSNFHIEKRYIHKSGKTVYVDLRLNILRDINGKPYQHIAQVVDITERIESEQKLKQTQARLTAVLNNLPNVAIYEYGTNVNFVSENIMDILGYSAAEFMSNESLFSKLMLNEDIKLYDEKVLKWKKSGAKGVISNEIRVRNKNNEVIWLEDHMFEVSPENGKPYYSGIMIDITAQKKTQLKMFETETKLTAILKNLPKVVIYQSGMNIDFISDNITDMIGYSTAEILGEKYFFGKIMHPEDIIGVKQQLIRWNKLNDGSILIMEFRIEKKDGGFIWIEDHMFRVRVNEKDSYLTGILIDVTERKLTEQKISRSLKEKELLLKEIHHRVKNNLQVVSSLLKLQSGYVKDENSLDILIDSQNRVRSMALVHQKLYQSKDFTEIDFSEYMQQLSQHLFNVFKSKSHDLEILINSADVSLSIDLAIPCGLILNELISNSLKYAFPEGRKGKINVALNCSNDREYEIIISDDGIGFPKEIDYKQTKSLGLQLVNTLVGQIDGTIVMENHVGTTFRIKFEKK
ncbi:MAG: PAS domain S-box protein [Ignavibacteria bacterium]